MNATTKRAGEISAADLGQIITGPFDSTKTGALVSVQHGLRFTTLTLRGGDQIITRAENTVSLHRASLAVAV